MTEESQAEDVMYANLHLNLYFCEPQRRQDGKTYMLHMKAKVD